MSKSWLPLCRFGISPGLSFLSESGVSKPGSSSLLVGTLSWSLRIPGRALERGTALTEWWGVQRGCVLHTRSRKRCLGPSCRSPGKRLPGLLSLHLHHALVANISHSGAALPSGGHPAKCIPGMLENLGGYFCFLSVCYLKPLKTSWKI